MDQLHRHLARHALAEAGAVGFCLADSYAVQAHGFLDRPSEDVDLFITTASRGGFSDALAAVVRANEAGRRETLAEVLGEDIPARYATALGGTLHQATHFGDDDVTANA